METDPAELSGSSGSGGQSGSGEGSGDSSAGSGSLPASSAPKAQQSSVAAVAAESAAAFPQSDPSASTACPPPQSAVAPSPAPVESKPAEPEPAPKPWNLTIVVKTEGGHPSTMVTVELEALDASTGAEVEPLWMYDNNEELKKSGSGHRRWKISASAIRFDLVAPAEVTLEDGDSKKVVLELRPSPWVGFHVVDMKDKPVIGVTLKVVLPDASRPDVVSNILPIKLFEIRPRGTCKIEEMIHFSVGEESMTSSTDAWEVESISSG